MRLGELDGIVGAEAATRRKQDVAVLLDGLAWKFAARTQDG